MRERVDSAEQELVSVVMPCYNDGLYIAEAIASVEAQTYPAIELIVVDDGSDDPQTLKALDALDQSRIMLLHTNRARPAGARNAGVRAASGTYILPLDADDIMEPEYIERAVEAMRADDRLGIVYCHGDSFGSERATWRSSDYDPATELAVNLIFNSAMYRRADWESVGGYCEAFVKGLEDYDFWLSILALDRTVLQLPETYFHYRFKPVSRSTQFDEDMSSVLETYDMIFQRHKDFFLLHIDDYCRALRQSQMEHVWGLRSHITELQRVQSLLAQRERQCRHLLPAFDSTDGSFLQGAVTRCWRALRRRCPRLTRVIAAPLTWAARRFHP